MSVPVETDRQGRTTDLKTAGFLKPDDLFLGRQMSDGSIVLEPCRLERKPTPEAQEEQ